MHDRLRYLIALFVSFVGSIGSSGPALAAGPLTLAEAQRQALEIAPLVMGQNASIRASREMAVAAGRRPDPELKLGVENLPVDGSDRFTIGNDFMTMRRIGVMQEFTRAGKLARRSERYEKEAEKGEAERDLTIANVARDTAIAWLETYYAEAIANVIVEQRLEAQREVEAAEAGYRSGRGGQADVFAARGAVVSLEERASDAQRRIAVARTSLSRWVGASANQPLAGTPDLNRIPEELQHEHLLLEHHPEVQVASKVESIAAAEVRVAQEDRTPDWTWELAYSKRSSPFSDMVSFGVSIPLPWDRANKQDREVTAKLALTQQAAARREDVVRMHTAEVKTMVAEWQNGLQRARRLETELVPLARERTLAAIGTYRGGKSTLNDVLLARRGELEAKLQVLQLELETARIWARLNFLFPKDLQEKERK
jgi:outer membrane protein TolC